MIVAHLFPGGARVDMRQQHEQQQHQQHQQQHSISGGGGGGGGGGSNNATDGLRPTRLPVISYVSAEY